MLDKLKKWLGIPRQKRPEEMSWEELAAEKGAKVLKWSPDDPIIVRLGISPSEVRKHLEWEEQQRNLPKKK